MLKIQAAFTQCKFSRKVHRLRRFSRSRLNWRERKKKLSIVDCQTIIGRANHVKKTNWWQFRGIFLFDDCKGWVLPKVLTKGAFVPLSSFGAQFSLERGHLKMLLHNFILM